MILPSHIAKLEFTVAGLALTVVVWFATGALPLYRERQHLNIK